MNLLTSCTGKDVLVTGAGGYIGSSLVKTIAASVPRSLTLLDHSEQNIFHLKTLLDTEFSFLSYQAIVGSINDATLIDSLFSGSRRHIVIHAAAFKHVELMELNPFAALGNNVLGTFTLAQAAVDHGCESLLLISTDKAVRPHSVMGVSKRLAELIVVSLSGPNARMNAIRLSNIRGATGSVVPIFLQQIVHGKPITITHPDVARVFMPVDEAVRAILAAAECRFSGCILMPPHRPPVRIVDLALSLIDVSRSPNFEFIGLKPGEKMSEDSIGPNETEYPDTEGSLIVLQTPALKADECKQMIDQLRTCIAQRDLRAILSFLTFTVPEYVPSNLDSTTSTLVHNS